MLVGSMIREQHQASSGATDVRVPRWLISAGPMARQHNSCPDWFERSDESEHIGAGRLLSDRREQPEGHQPEGLLFDPRALSRELESRIRWNSGRSRLTNGSAECVGWVVGLM